MNLSSLIRVMLAAFALSACQTFAEPAGPIGFDLYDVNDANADYRSADYAGKPILLDFYFAACPACQRNHGNVHAAAEEFHGADGQVAEISIDCEQEEWDSWIDRYSISTPVLNDCDRVLAERLGVRSYPTTIVLGRDHNVAYRFVGVWTAAAKARIYQEMRR
jgi:peroxiredoxin